jgi:hypothetical protein
MEPYSPAFRSALKDAHPGLQDAEIDRLEELTTRRAQTLPERDAHIMLSLDEQINELVRDKMPNFHRVTREYSAIVHAERAASRVSPKVEIKHKR